MKQKKCTLCKKVRYIKFFPQRKDRKTLQFSSRCRDCLSKIANEYWHKNNEKCRKLQRDRQRKLRIEVLSYYSDGSLKCKCCGETEVCFLSIDHINGGGTKHRRNTGYGGHIYHWLKQNKYPEGYRVLCHNCNMSFGCYGFCPHQR